MAPSTPDPSDREAHGVLDPDPLGAGGEASDWKPSAAHAHIEPIFGALLEPQESGPLVSAPSSSPVGWRLVISRVWVWVRWRR